MEVPADSVVGVGVVASENLARCSSCQQFARSPDMYMAAHVRKPLVWTKKAKNKVP